MKNLRNKKIWFVFNNPLYNMITYCQILENVQPYSDFHCSLSPTLGETIINITEIV